MTKSILVIFKYYEIKSKHFMSHGQEKRKGGEQSYLLNVHEIYTSNRIRKTYSGQLHSSFLQLVTDIYTFSTIHFVSFALNMHLSQLCFVTLDNQLLSSKKKKNSHVSIRIKYDNECKTCFMLSFSLQSSKIKH